MESAVIVRVDLPADLDRLRRRCVAGAALGVPAHVTLLYPFVEPAALTVDIQQTVASIAFGHSSFSFELTGPGQWPDTVYAAVDPEERFLAIHGDLAAAFPGYPIYGRPAFELIPHVTIANCDCVRDPATLQDVAWAALPATRSVDALDVIAQADDGRWQTVWTAPLARPSF